MIRIAIVEDDRHDREALKKCLNRYEKENQMKFSVTEFQDGEDIVTDYTASYDLIILDIEMAFLNGMKAAEKIRELDTNVIIIFITNMPQYAIQGYKVNALDYILKPISYFSFSESMVRALAKVKTPEKEYITIVLKGGKKKLDVARICYVEVQDHVLIYHTLDGDFETKGTMRDTDNQFDSGICGFHDSICRITGGNKKNGGIGLRLFHCLVHGVENGKPVYGAASFSGRRTTYHIRTVFFHFHSMKMSVSARNTLYQQAGRFINKYAHNVSPFTDFTTIRVASFMVSAT